jgi:hypothetical protein
LCRKGCDTKRPPNRQTAARAIRNLMPMVKTNA